MNLDFSDDQKFLQEEARKFLEKEQALNRNRSVLETDNKFDEDLWEKIVELGWTGIRIPEDYGGLGLGHLELCVIAEELGRFLAPVPYSSSVYLFTEAIINYGTDEIKKDFLPKLVSGEIVGTIGVTEELHAPTKDNINLVYADGKINGKKIAVPDAGVATHAIVVAKSDKGISLQLVDLSTTGVTVEHQENIDESRGHFSISFNDVETKLLGDKVSGWELYETLINQAAVLFSYEQIGGSQASLDMAINYAKERYAFGRPIGSYQAIKHKLADMYIALTLAKSNCYYAAWALSTNAADLPSASATARVSATKAFQLCSKENIQTHGGNGFTWEYDCHMFYRRSKLLSLNIGSLSNWREKLVTSLEQSNIN
jgi:alkylation response protein AidB-like acyl-CoA dehydrogenase|tara:strand:+ start:116 stop:1228 length:1113 start_codon:yes stop_codon:yes gene_type:complete